MSNRAGNDTTSILSQDIPQLPLGLAWERAAMKEVLSIAYILSAAGFDSPSQFSAKLRDLAEWSDLNYSAARWDTESQLEMVAAVADELAMMNIKPCDLQHLTAAQELDEVIGDG